MIDLKYKRDWQLGLKKNLQDSVVKPIIFTAQRIKFCVKDLFNKCEQIRSFMRINSHLLKKSLTENIIFWALVQANRQETTVKMKKTYSLKNHVTSLFTFFKKVSSICDFFTAWCLDVRFYNLLYFYLFELLSTVLVSSSLQGEKMLYIV